MKRSIYILILFLHCFVLPGKAQTRIIDSLKKNIGAAVSKNEKVKAIFFAFSAYCIKVSGCRVYPRSHKEKMVLIFSSLDVAALIFLFRLSIILVCALHGKTKKHKNKVKMQIVGFIK